MSLPPATASHVEALKAARAKIEQGWCQHVSARDSDGAAVFPDDPCAVAWCPIGALRTIQRQAGTSDILREVIFGDDPFWGAISVWNDDCHRTKEEVLAAFDKAIALAESRS